MLLELGILLIHSNVGECYKLEQVRFLEHRSISIRLLKGLRRPRSRVNAFMSSPLRKVAWSSSGDKQAHSIS